MQKQCDRMNNARRITLLAGGVGGAKLAEGLARSRHGPGLTIIGNVGDDHEFHGLHVSPDIDTLIYSLSDQVNRDQGWGLAGDSYRLLGRLAQLGCDTWMKLGDLDFATHVRRSELLATGHRLTEVVATLARQYDVDTPIRLPTDAPVRTRLKTDLGWLAFQEYFVREQCRPTVLDIEFAGADDAVPTPEALSALETADLIIVAPSNPLVSIGPMLAIPDFKQALQDSPAIKIAVSPLIGGRTVKGPADRMLESLGHRVDNLGIAEFYDGLIDALVVDHADSTFTQALQDTGLHIICEDILMRDAGDKRRLAESVITHANSIRGQTCQST